MMLHHSTLARALVAVPLHMLPFLLYVLCAPSSLRPPLVIMYGEDNPLCIYTSNQILRLEYEVV